MNTSNQNLDWFVKEKESICIVKLIPRSNNKILIDNGNDNDEIAQAFLSNEKAFAENLEDGSLLIITSQDYLFEICNVLKEKRRTGEYILQKLRNPKSDQMIASVKRDHNVEIINQPFLHILKTKTLDDFIKLLQNISETQIKTEVTRGTKAWGADSPKRGRSQNRSISPYRNRSKSNKYEESSSEKRTAQRKSKSPNFALLKNQVSSPPAKGKEKENNMLKKQDDILDITFNNQKDLKNLQEEENKSQPLMKNKNQSKFPAMNENQNPFGFPSSKDMKLRYELKSEDEEYRKIQKLLNIGFPRAVVTRITKHETYLWKDFREKKSELSDLKEYTVFFQYSKDPRDFIEQPTKRIENWERRISHKLTSDHSFYNKSNRNHCSVLGCVVLVDSQEKVHACYSAYIIDFKY